MKRRAAQKPQGDSAGNKSNEVRDQQHVDAALAAAGVTVCHVDMHGRILFNAAAQEKFGVAEEASFASLIRGVARQHRRDLVAAIRGVRNLQQQRSSEFRFTSPAGGIFWIGLTARRMSEHCLGDCAAVAMIDMTEQHKAVEALEQSEEHLRYTVEFNPQLPWVADPTGQITDVTDRWLSATGMTREFALGEGWFSVTHPDDIVKVNEKIVRSLTTGEPFDVRMRLCVHGVYRWMRAQGFPRRDDRGNVMRWYGYTEDIHEHVLVEDQIRWNAEHDPLTGLANRSLLYSRLEAALVAAPHGLSRVGVLLIDLDHFKEVNDLLGHHAGDELLVRYAEQLRATLPEDCLIARLGGDEFAVLFPAVRDREELLGWGEATRLLRATVSAAAGQPECRASLGAAIYPDHGQNPSELMRHADIALYAAKEGGRGSLLLFELHMQDEIRERAAMVARARTAAESGDILAYYQPKVSLVTGELIGFEALLRWRDAHGKIHAPGSIQAAFEETDVADMLGQAMLDHVISDISSWKRQGLNFGHVAINAAPAEFNRNNFAPRLINALREAGLSPDVLEVEITEGVFLGHGADRALEAINFLHKSGISIVLDDFGTGFASLSHLRALPVSTLKIDRSFVSHIAEENGDAAIVSAIVKLGDALGIKVVAEGIENQVQADILRGFGCRFAQGYYFGMPTPAIMTPQLIRDWTGRPARSVSVAGG